MGLSTIANQPLFFGTRKETQSCKKDDPECLLIQDGDDLFIQFLNEPCDATSLICDSFFAGMSLDLVTNGGFVGSAAGWSLGVTWSYDAEGFVKSDDTVGSNLTQSIPALVEDQCYILVFTVRDYVAGTLTPSVGGISGTSITANGTYRQVITAGATTDLIFAATGNPNEFGVSNVSLYSLGPCWCADNGSLFPDGTNDMACHLPGEETTLTVVNSLPDIDTGKTYKVVVTISGATSGSVHVIVGTSATSRDFVGAGTFTDYVTADGDDNFQVVFSSDSDACVSATQVFLINTEHNFIIANPDNVSVQAVDPFVTYDKNRGFLKINTSDFDFGYGCYRLVAQDTCDVVLFDSGCFNYQEEFVGTRLIKAIDREVGDNPALDRYSFGFSWPPLLFALTLRVRCEFRKPTQDSKLNSDRFSTGRYFKSYVEQSKKWELVVLGLSETQHDCLAIMLKCKYLTIDGEEYFNDEEEYAPLWDDKGYNNTADVKIIIRKKQGVLFSDNCNR